jgi:hypothetical protein
MEEGEGIELNGEYRCKVAITNFSVWLGDNFFLTFVTSLKM